MRVLILSDIHANLVAFEAVLEAAKDHYDQIWFLGDLIGYGPGPNACVALMQTRARLCLSGNHDWAALGKLDIDEFNAEARAAILWTRKTLTAPSRIFLEPLPPMQIEGDYTLAHGSPRHPVWEYVLDYETAAANFAHFGTQYCLIGHSHMPLIIVENSPGEIESLPVVYDEAISIGSGRYMINPGSVGQPRDGDPRAAYALLNTVSHTWEFCRVAYDIEETQRQMRALALPEPLIARLSHGW
ncbi:MAG: metallophosphoesterase family protein [Candidatus Promineifilaceae bacterium]